MSAVCERLLFCKCTPRSRKCRGYVYLSSASYANPLLAPSLFVEHLVLTTSRWMMRAVKIFSSLRVASLTSTAWSLVFVFSFSQPFLIHLKSSSSTSFSICYPQLRTQSPLHSYPQNSSPATMPHHSLSILGSFLLLFFPSPCI